MKKRTPHNKKRPPLREQKTASNQYAYKGKCNHMNKENQELIMQMSLSEKQQLIELYDCFATTKTPQVTEDVMFELQDKKLVRWMPINAEVKWWPTYKGSDVAAELKAFMDVYLPMVIEHVCSEYDEVAV